ncbi:hypothetical protein [Crenothrix polyspora]|uniref:Uncharacterized protein n=1 Tax=Crenothrix polyspora TaxID=360316 RepID=A0A1R4H1A7_9GAMM|nr:hypothetical protein [Crenothrix polyspora]SJM89986.1 hypothetical protein CRENPOLYSF1_1290010 [Crenothrix polyspora]
MTDIKTGDVFWSFTAGNITENSYGKSRWYTCECGKKRVIVNSVMLLGKVKSCGCKRHQKKYYAPKKAKPVYVPLLGYALDINRFSTGKIERIAFHKITHE